MFLFFKGPTLTYFTVALIQSIYASLVLFFFSQIAMTHVAKIAGFLEKLFIVNY